jgi:hypothetical protein
MSDIKPALKKPVPDWRTIVPGVWLDVLDDISYAFKAVYNGMALRVILEDLTDNILTVPFLIERSVATLAVDTIVDSREVTLTAGHGAVVGNILEIADPSSSSFFMQSQITAVNVNVLTLDQPVNRVYTAASAQVVVSSDSILVDGSVTPQIFNILPLPTQRGHMVRLIWEMRSLNDMSFDTFGGANALINGCVLRVNNGDGTYKNLFNFKNNGDVAEQCFDTTYLAGKNNVTKGFLARLTWGGQEKHGAVVALDGAIGQRIELIVQDDLTVGNTRFHLTAQGHEVS